MDSNIQQVAENLVQKAGFQNDMILSPIESGGNNRVFKVNSGGHSFLLKFYFYHESDSRDRLKNEFSFISFCWNQGISLVPKPFASDRSNRAALYEFIQGRKPNPDEVTQDLINQSLDFFLQVNSLKDNPDAHRLPDASDACFSVNEHVDSVDRRVKRLQSIRGTDTISHEAVDFINNRLAPEWVALRNRVLKEAKTYSIDPDALIQSDDRCLSPSDFGFHNAIIEQNNKLRFIDFEYAGWDDPAKMVCDFFCQPAVPVPMSYFDMFVEAVVNCFPEPEKVYHRIKILFPIHQIKWACIMLNDFHPIDSLRRKFAIVHDDEEKHRIFQLEKAHNALNCLQ